MSVRNYLRMVAATAAIFVCLEAAATKADSPAANATSQSNGSGGRPASDANACEFGLEGDQVNPQQAPAMLKAVRELGAGFVVIQFRPAANRGGVSTETYPNYHAFSLACRDEHLTFYANQEITNYSCDGGWLDRDGHDMLAHPDGTHRWDIAGELLARMTKYPEFRGVLYDEVEHGQMRRDRNTNGGSDTRSTHRVHPYFAVTDGMTLEQAYDAVYRNAKTVADEYRRHGVAPMTEEVFPVMLHTFARAGFDPNIKFLKEGITPVFAAIALGAAKQYDREFGVSPDLWGMPRFMPDKNGRPTSGFPGHPPEELRASLLYAYWMGARRIFVENIFGMIHGHDVAGGVEFEPTEYGKVYRWFVKEYVPAHPRPYSFRDIRPEVAIVRFDDSCWGQRESWLPDALYGAANLKTTPATAAWFGIWNVLTHGQTRPEGISYHNRNYDAMPHDFFCPLRGVVMYDHLAGERELKDVKLVFLTGVKISPATLKAVRAFVASGGLCVTLPSLAPPELAGRRGEVSEGKGKWFITEDFRSPEARKAVAPFLGRPDEISYRFGPRVLTVRRGKDGNTIRIYLQDEAAAAKNAGDPPSASRVW